MIFVFEVSYKMNGSNLPVKIVEIKAQNKQDAIKQIHDDCPNGYIVRHCTLVGSRLI
jgi:hypothetical protein